MPELPEVETIRRDLLERLKGDKLQEIHIKDNDYLKKRAISQEGLLRLQGKELTDILRKGKQLAFILSDVCLLFHLGLTGSLIFRPQTEAPELNTENYKHLVLLLRFCRGTLLFSDTRKFGNLWLFPVDILESHWDKTLGPDALLITKEHFRDILRRGRGQIKKFLLDQKNIAGLGNIYVDELLFRAKIHPERRVESLDSEEIERLYIEMKNLLDEAILLRGSSIRDYVDGTGTPGLFQTRHQVYGKRGKPCPGCGTPLRYITLQGRGTTFCPTCQK